MCGIGFVVNYEDDPIQLEVIECMFKNMESRGDDASGIYYERPGEDGKTIARVFKAPVNAEDLWNSVQEGKGKHTLPEDYRNKWKLNGTERLIMLHTRAATKGPVSNNHNNMPIYSKNWVLIHNGVIDRNTPRIDAYKYKGTVDSEDILAHLDTSGSIAKTIKAVSGSMSIAARRIGKDYIYLYRNSNPLDLVIPAKKRMIFGCSRGEYAADKELIELMDKDSPFSGGYKSIATTPYTIYKLHLSSPKIVAVAEFQPTLGIIDAANQNLLPAHS